MSSLEVLQHPQTLEDHSIDISRVNFHIINVIYGREYTDAFLQASLPLQLCSSNLGVFPKSTTRYRIFTTQEDWEYMQSHPNMRKLQDVVQVEFIEIPLNSFLDGYYEPMKNSHNRAILDAKQENAAMIFLAPDNLISSETFQTILRYVSQGKRVVFMLGPSLKKDEMVPLIKTLYEYPEMINKGIKPRELVHLAMDHLHPITESLMATNEEILSIPYMILWKLDSHNLLGHGFFYQPIFIWPEVFVTPENTIDMDLVPVACPTVEKWIFIQDSDEGVAFEISDYARDGSTPRLLLPMMQCNPGTVAEACKNHYVFPFNQYLARYPIYFHSSDLREEWLEVQHQANIFIEECLLQLSLMDEPDF